MSICGIDRGAVDRGPSPDRRSMQKMFSQSELEKMTPREREACLLAYVNVKLTLAKTWIGSDDHMKVAWARDALGHNHEVWEALSRDLNADGNALPADIKTTLGDLYVLLCAISAQASGSRAKGAVESLIAINAHVIAGLQAPPPASKG